MRATAKLWSRLPLAPTGTTGPFHRLIDSNTSQLMLYFVFSMCSCSALGL